MAEENVQEMERAENEVPPLPEGESDDLGAAMVDEDQAVEERLETEDKQFQGEMEGEDAKGEADGQ